MMLQVALVIRCSNNRPNLHRSIDHRNPSVLVHIEVHLGILGIHLPKQLVKRRD